MRDERKRDARERTPSRTRYLASSARVRWNAPYGRWRRAVTNQSIRLAVHSAKMAIWLTADLWGNLQSGLEFRGGAYLARSECVCKPITRLNSPRQTAATLRSFTDLQHCIDHKSRSSLASALSR